MTSNPKTKDSRTPGVFRSVQISRERALHATPVFDTYWRFAKMRQDIFMKRIVGAPPPYTDDPVLSAHRFLSGYFSNMQRVTLFLQEIACLASGR